MKEMNRREFMKTAAIGGAVLGLGGIALHKPLEALASGKYDIGHVRASESSVFQSWDGMTPKYWLAR